MKNTINLEEVKNFIQAQGPDTRIYIGCDSECYNKNNKWYADYALVVVVHINGRHGCRIFGEVQKEQIYDSRKDRPALRLMTEVYKISELYLKLNEVLEGRKVEVHLDINPNDMYGSSCVIQQAIGYIRGVCNVDAKVKPEAFAASYAADRFKTIREYASGSTALQ